MSKKRILVIDDEQNMRHMLKVLLTKSGYDIETAANGQEALEIIQGEQFNFVLCDIKMPKLDGLAFLKSTVKKKITIPIIMMSAYGTIDTAVEAMKSGAYDYISKPFKTDEVLLTLKKAEERERLKSENIILRQKIQKIGDTYKYANIVAKSDVMQSVFDIIKKVADYKTTILITGESGTGKELVAKAIHYNGIRSKGNLVSINCGGIPETLLESELFGYKKGAFTDAYHDKKGHFEEADKGTIFLDEIGELPPSLQIKMLRVLQEEEISPLGSAFTKKVDLRVIAATSKDLKKEIKNGNFREDLFYRINVINIYLPPLRDRTEDIPLLVDHFINSINHKLKKNVKGISPDVFRIFMGHSWPGNIRELENVLERSVLLTQDTIIHVQDLPSNLITEQVNISDITSPDTLSIKVGSQILEKQLIERALKKTSGNKTHAAKILEISRPMLISKIKDYGLG